jgi:preprotein translocase subunit SecG
MKHTGAARDPRSRLGIAVIVTVAVVVVGVLLMHSTGFGHGMAMKTTSPPSTVLRT